MKSVYVHLDSIYLSTQTLIHMHRYVCTDYFRCVRSSRQINGVMLEGRTYVHRYTCSREVDIVAGQEKSCTSLSRTRHLRYLSIHQSVRQDAVKTFLHESAVHFFLFAVHLRLRSLYIDT